MEKNNWLVPWYGNKLKKLWLMARFTICIFLIGMFTANAGVFSQNEKVSLSMKNVNLKNVIWEIEKQTGFVFMYSTDDVDKAGKVDVIAVNKTVKEVLKSCLEGTCLSFVIQDNVIIIKPGKKVKVLKIEEKDITIKGIVKDSKGVPLPGVSVAVKGTNTGTSTDSEGRFVLNLKKEDILIISFIGMETQEISIKEQSGFLNIILREKRQEIKEVMVVAYGVAKKESFTGSAEVVDKKTLTRTTSNRISTALLGKVSGVQVDNSSGEAGVASSIRIRGFGSFSAGSSPLYVVDGVAGAPIPNNQDVESVTVLKDAAAASLYGSRAANGVIIITTKKGKGKIKFNVKYRHTISWKSPDNFNLMNTEQYMSKAWEGLYNKIYYHDNNAQNLEVGSQAEVAIHKKAVSYAHRRLIEKIGGNNPYAHLVDGKYVALDQPFDDNGKLKEEANLMYETDWLDNAYRVGHIDDFHISASKGNDKSSLYTSLSYYGQDGIAIANWYKKITATLNCSTKVNDFFEYGFNSYMRYSEGKEVKGGLFTDSYTYNPTMKIYELDENYKVKRDDNGNPIYDWNNPIELDYNIHGQIHYNDDGYDSKSMYASPYIKLIPLKCLTIDAKASVRMDGGTSYWFSYPEHAAGKGKNGLSHKASWEDKFYYGFLMATFDKKFGRHSFNFKVGYEAEDYKKTDMSATAKGYNLWRVLRELNNGEEPDNVYSGTLEESKISYISNLQYGFADKYYLSASFRRDGSSRLGPDKRWGNFWSVGGTWRLSEENFIKRLGFVDNLKLRVSYGVNGNDNIGNDDIGHYLYHSTYNMSCTYLNKLAAIYKRFGNAALGWESNKNLTIGTEFRFFDRLSGSLEWYKRISSDLLLEKPYAESLGFNRRFENVGEIENSGVELSLTYEAIKGEDFSWVTGLTLSHNTNKITKLADGDYWIGQTYRGEGLSIYNIRARQWAGVDKENGDALWYRNYVTILKDGKEEKLYYKEKEELNNVRGIVSGKEGRETTNKWSEASFKDYGDVSPDFYGAWNNEIRYKNFNLSFQFYYSIGGMAYNDLYGLMHNDGERPKYNLLDDASDSWTRYNTDAKHPVFVSGYKSCAWYRSSRFIDDLDYVKLKRLTLSYDLNPDFLHRFKIQNASLSITGENLLTITNFVGYDPELSLDGTTSYGVPPMTSVSLGLNIIF